MRRAEILIGTSGFDYPEWRGVFYPMELKRSEFLEYYATKFNALEVNSSFYSMPDSSHLVRFAERSEKRIKFAVKANRTLTHEIGKDWKNRAEEMLINLRPLANMGLLSAVLFQLPQSFHYTPENRFYLADLISEFRGFEPVVEFRHREWLRASVYEGLSERGASIVFCDMPPLRFLPDGKICRTPFVGPNAYIRMHGRNSGCWYDHSAENNGSQRYDYEYSQDELESFVPVIGSALKEGRKVQTFFNNHPKGSGARNALSLADIIRKFRRPSPSEG